ncbi:MAG: hypothetical protein IIZ12_00320 [Eggerthellaceae bacterium]|nr:hypothetical protein [Eggerthellaceae bacterium]
MTTILTDNQHYSDIADAIREQLGVQTTYLPSEMAAAILTIEGGGSSIDPSTVSWANSSWDDIAAALAGHYAGDFDLTEYWNIGDTRSVSLSAMSATGVNESHAAQTVELVIMAAKHYDMSDNSGKAVFVIGQKDILAEKGYINSTSSISGGWDSCARRTWCNDVYKAALPSDLQSLVKQVNIVTSNGSGSTTATSSDYIFLPAEKEVFGSNSNANSTAEASLSQYSWYQTASNRKKNQSGSAGPWWERSPYTTGSGMCCRVIATGEAAANSANSTEGIAPHFCI